MRNPDPRVPRRPTKQWACRSISLKAEDRRFRVRRKRESGSHRWAILQGLGEGHA